MNSLQQRFEQTLLQTHPSNTSATNVKNLISEQKKKCSLEADIFTSESKIENKKKIKYKTIYLVWIVVEDDFRKCLRNRMIWL